MTGSEIGLVVHATHEAGFKIGGIGAVLDGLLTTAAYNQAVNRTLLVGSMDTADKRAMARLDVGGALTVIYSSWHGLDEAPASVSRGLAGVEARFGVHLFYGRRRFRSASTGKEAEHEVLLVEPARAYEDETNRFKLQLWYHYGIQSDRYERIDEFERTVRAARPAMAALDLLTAGQASGQRFLVAHEWMGIPLAFCAQIEAGRAWRLVFYAHEMATARILVEGHPGHDTRFYNALRLARSGGLTMDQLFGDRRDFFKHVLIRHADRFHAFLAVGRWVAEEFRFLGGGFNSATIDLVYNGTDCPQIDLEARTRSHRLLQAYCQNLLGYRPDYVFSHVTRMAVSKGLWRDLCVLEHLDKLLAADQRRAVLFILASIEPAGRAPEDVLRWEMEYGWPVVHHAGNGDLIGHERPLFQGIEAFNSRSRAIKVVLVNQYGWEPDRCGVKMPAGMTFSDLRQGTDLEFGQSIYEPFGISQLEPLGYGALCIVSSICGCAGYVEQAVQAAGLGRFPNFLQVDYETLGNGQRVHSAWEALWIDQTLRDQVERTSSFPAALAIRATLPVTENQRRILLNRGQQVSAEMCWESVVADRVLPALRRVG